MGIKKNSLLAAAGLSAALLTTGQSLNFYEEALPTSMNPLYAKSMVDTRVNELVFDRLYFHSPINNSLVSRLVDQWQMSEGGRAMQLTLKSGVKWHDGTPFTAADVCFTIDAMLDEGTPSPIAAKQREVFAGCEVKEENIALVRFTKIFHNPRNRLGFYVMPSHSFEGNTAISPDHEFSNRPMGTGPLKGNRGRRGVSFNAVPNAHHQAKVPQMSLQEGADPLVQVRTLQNNGVQGIITVPPPYRADVSASDELSLKSYDLRSWWFVAVNTNKKHLSDKRVRQALNSIVDRTELRKLSIGVEEGEQNSPCEFISGPFVQTSPYYNRAVEVQETADLDSALSLLQAGGMRKVGGTWHYRGEPVNLKIGIKASLDVEAPDLLSQVSNQLGAAGFQRQQHKISTDEWNRMVVTGQAEDYDLIIGKWSFGLVEDVNPLFHTRTGGRGGLNIFNYSSTAVDTLLAQFDGARTDTQAQDAYHELHEVLADDLPYLFLWKLDTKSAWQTSVRGNMISAYYYWTDFDSWKYIQ
ncbi:MAG: ABC transporter substrate-binding protein [Myxococcota bacterium]|nr:ABC transporter substrate-binding protein [Myxococcota bacterium]